MDKWGTLSAACKFCSHLCHDRQCGYGCEINLARFVQNVYLEQCITRLQNVIAKSYMIHEWYEPFYIVSDIF